MIPKVRFGKTGLEVTRLALGGYPFGGVNLARGWDPFSSEGRAQAIETIHAALDAGITLVDTAPGYGDGNSESIIGEALAGRRDEVVLATKVGYHGTAADVRAECRGVAPSPPHRCHGRDPVPRRHVHLQ